MLQINQYFLLETQAFQTSLVTHLFFHRHSNMEEDRIYIVFYSEMVLFIYLKGKVADRQGGQAEMFHLFSHFLWLQRLGLGQAESRDQKFLCCFPHECRVPSTWVIFCWF